MNPPTPLTVEPRASWARIGFEQLVQDFRLTLRQLRLDPVFSFTVILTYALAIGACTVVFTAINTTLLHPLPGPEADRTVIIHETRLPKVPQAQVSPPAFLDLERETKSFAALSAWVRGETDLTENGEPQRLSAGFVTRQCFRTWGTSVDLGREFTAGDYVPGADDVVILGYPLWQGTFGGRRDIIGRKVLLDGAPCTVIGVMSDRFARYGSDLQLWEPLVFNANQRSDRARGAHYLQVTGILRPGVTREQAQAELDVIATQFARQYPATNRGWGLLVRDLSAYINRTLAPLLYVLLGAVLCVLLVAGANVANLLLARATVRQQELAVKAALGAGQWRIMRQLLVESMVLAVLGGAGGGLIAAGGLNFIRTFAPTASTDLGRLAYAHLDPTMLGFTLAFSIVTGLGFGVVPAWMAARGELGLTLKQGGRGASGARGRFRNTLVAVEVAMALVLLTGAGLLIRSFGRLTRLDPGFSLGSVATMAISLRPPKYGSPVARTTFTDALLARLAALPRVEAAAVSFRSPLENPPTLAFSIDNQAALSPDEQPEGVVNLVSPDYFRALGIRLRHGRAFTDRDNGAGLPVVVINEALVRQYFAHSDPIGRHLIIGLPGQPAVAHEIVGVVGDVIQGDPVRPVLPQYYLPWLEFNTSVVNVFVRTRGDPATALAMIKSQVYAVDRDQPVGLVRTLREWVDLVLARQRLTLRLLSAFAAIALIIAGVGIYGVMAYTVNQRRMEYGIRMALGAGRGDVLRHVLARGLAVVAIGLALGVVLALVLGQFVSKMLYATSPRDPLTLAVIVVVLLTVAAVACLLPAWRATKVDPMIAMRAE